jgi:thiol-disulfide isomerase/thioredoxin
VETFSKGGKIHGIVMKSISSGKDIDFSQFKGKKIIFDFWSSWCEPCIEMFPIINKIKKDVEDGEGTVKILSISVDPMPGKVKEIMKKKKVQFEVLNAPPELANAGILMPYMAVADENGIIIATTSGKHTYEEIIKMIGGEKTPEK